MMLSEMRMITPATAPNLIEIAKFPLGWITGLAWSAYGHRLAVSNAYGVALYHFTSDHIIRHTLGGHDDPVRAVACSPDGHWMASGGDDSKILLWNVHTEPPTPTHTLLTHAPVQNISFAPDGGCLAAVYEDVIGVWRDYAVPPHLLKGHEGDVTSVTFSENGAWLASGGWDNTVRIWSMAGALLQTLEGHTARVNDMAFNPDSTRLASVDRGGEMLVWDTATWAAVERLVPHQHKMVDTVAYSPDGSLLATGGRDQQVRLWDAISLQPLVALSGHRKAIIALEFRPDGVMLATGSGDNSVRLWAVAKTE